MALSRRRRIVYTPAIAAVLRSGCPIRIPSVNDRNDFDEQLLLNDSVDHPILTASGRIERIEGFAQLLSKAAGILAQGANNEFEGCGGYLLRKLFRERNFGRFREANLISLIHCSDSRF
ncbi:hypothetical protein [Rathayibacter soli]